MIHQLIGVVACETTNGLKASADEREVVAVTEPGTVTTLEASSGGELATPEWVPIPTFATPADLGDRGSAEVRFRETVASLR